MDSDPQCHADFTEDVRTWQGGAGKPYQTNQETVWNHKLETKIL
jgi:hypothetical protein